MKTRNGSYLQQFSKNLQLILLPKHSIVVLIKRFPNMSYVHAKIQRLFFSFSINFKVL